MSAKSASPAPRKRSTGPGRGDQFAADRHPDSAPPTQHARRAERTGQAGRERVTIERVREPGSGRLIWKFQVMARDGRLVRFGESFSPEDAADGVAWLRRGNVEVLGDDVALSLPPPAPAPRLVVSGVE